MARIEIWLKQTSWPIVHEGVLNAYQKGAFYCVLDKDGVTKYPIQDIFRVREPYDLSE